MFGAVLGRNGGFRLERPCDQLGSSSNTVVNPNRLVVDGVHMYVLRERA